MKRNIRIILLILLAIVILCPPYLICQRLPACKMVFGWLFGADVSHIIARFILYGVLACLILSVFSEGNPPISWFIMILGVLSLAVIQEVIQLLTGQGPVGWDDIFDILVDISGAIIGIGVFGWKWGRDR